MSDSFTNFLGLDTQPPKTPALSMPAEWEPMDALWMSFPTAPALWDENRPQAERDLAKLIAVLARYAPVRLNCAQAKQDAVRAWLKQAGAPSERVAFFDIATDDVWCRDHGATFVYEQETRKLAAVNWVYNGWGDKFPHTLDAEVAHAMALATLIPRYDSPLVCEGGALEINSQGALLTTESVLLNPNRNPDWSKKDIEAELRAKLGATEIIWLKDGLSGDDTDGHIDMLTRFFADDGIVTLRAKDDRNPSYHALEENYERLQALRTPTGGHYDIAALPVPEPLTFNQWRYDAVPISHANFLILNEGVIVPTYARDKEDREALGLLRELFPAHEVVGVDAQTIAQEGGAIHCLTQQVPKQQDLSAKD